MFHHFHDDDFFIQQQGSISSSQFEAIIKKLLGAGYKIIDPSEYIRKILCASLLDKEIVFTFDDALKCQYKIALPILAEYKIKAFFFIQSSALVNSGDLNFEVFRDFRHRCFDNISDFYRQFFKKVSPEDILKTQAFIVRERFLSDRSYLSEEDKMYRACRDFTLTKQAFENIHLELMQYLEYDWHHYKKALNMSRDDVRKVIDAGHEIGLHSFSHPLDINSLSLEDHILEYEQNKSHLERAFDISVKSASYPCGLTNSSVADALDLMGIRLGFMATPDYSNNNRFELPRSNHVSLIA